MFFKRVVVNASFENSTLKGLQVAVQPVGEHAESEEADLSEAYSSLLGAKMPLNLADHPVQGQPDYLSQAVAIALNQAYEASFAGQQ